MSSLAKMFSHPAALLAQLQQRLPAVGPAEVGHWDQMLEQLRRELNGQPADYEHAVRTHTQERMDRGHSLEEVIGEFDQFAGMVLEFLRTRGASPTLEELAEVRSMLLRGVMVAAHVSTESHLQERKRQLASSLGFLSHDIRDQLAAVLMLMETLRRKEPAAADSDSFQRLHTRLKRLSLAANDALSHLDLDIQPDLVRVALLVDTLLSELREELSFEAQAREIAIEVDAPHGLELLADERLLRSALGNLVQNAVKFSRPNSRVQLRARADGPWVWLEVEDACGGLGPEKMRRMFQLGQEHPGQGLGLVLARRMAESHDGELTVRDLPGRGCVMQMKLPLQVKRA